MRLAHGAASALRVGFRRLPAKLKAFPIERKEVSE